MNAFLKYMAGLIKNHVASPINQKNTGDEDVRPLPSKTPVNQERIRMIHTSDNLIVCRWSCSD